MLFGLIAKSYIIRCFLIRGDKKVKCTTRLSKHHCITIPLETMVNVKTLFVSLVNISNLMEIVSNVWKKEIVCTKIQPIQLCPFLGNRYVINATKEQVPWKTRSDLQNSCKKFGKLNHISNSLIYLLKEYKELAISLGFVGV